MNCSILHLLLKKAFGLHHPKLFSYFRFAFRLLFL